MWFERHVGRAELELLPRPPFDERARLPGEQLAVRVGRQELKLGSSRLASVRESPNVRRTFDGIRVSWTDECAAGVRRARSARRLRYIDRNWQVALNVNNVLDKTYYESIDTPPLHAWYGEPRNWILRIDGRY